MASRAENSIRAQERDRAAQNMETEEQNQEGSSSRRTSPCKKKQKRWDWRGDERTYKKMITEVSKAIANVVRYGPAEQTWHDQQEQQCKLDFSMMGGAMECGQKLAFMGKDSPNK